MRAQPDRIAFGPSVGQRPGGRHRAVLAAACQALPVGGERHELDGSQVPPEGGDLLPRGHIPQLDSVDIRDREGLAIWAEGQTQHAVIKALNESEKPFIRDQNAE